MHNTIIYKSVHVLIALGAALYIISFANNYSHDAATTWGFLLLGIVWFGIAELFYQRIRKRAQHQPAKQYIPPVVVRDKS